MKLLIVSATLACLLCVVIGCNSRALKSGAGALIADAKTPQDVYKLSTDAKKDKAKALPVTFSHVNHATKNYSIDGTKPITCVECHHTEQPAAEAAKHPPLKSAYPADRTATLTAETAKDAKTPDVQNCRACHAQEGDKPKLLDENPKVTYEGDTDATVLTNEEAYHRNCNGCHDQAVEKRKGIKAPSTNECNKCHTGT
jgi:nitrate/TMAO reductase-like tetraheme cytochrome c subunit